jgi:hypothetical protein
MAGEWIKMRGNLWDDPRVAAIVDATDSTEAAVVGALYWLWATGDQHTENGFLPGLSLRQIDRKTGVPGFAQALCNIGWLTEESDGVTIINFSDHNGASAKRRCVEAQRKANSRNVSASNADNTQTDGGQVRTDSGAREEKRREEKKDTEPSGSVGAKRGAKFCPASFAVTDEMRQWAAIEAPRADVDRETQKMRDHEFKTTRTDWHKAWRNWLRKAHDDAAPIRAPTFADKRLQQAQDFAPGIAASPLNFIDEVRNVPSIASR